MTENSYYHTFWSQAVRLDASSVKSILPKMPVPKVSVGDSQKCHHHIWSKVPCRIYFRKTRRCFTTWELNKTTPLGHSKFNTIFEFTMISFLGFLRQIELSDLLGWMGNSIHYWLLTLIYSILLKHYFIIRVLTAKNPQSPSRLWML